MENQTQQQTAPVQAEPPTNIVANMGDPAEPPKPVEARVIASSKKPAKSKSAKSK